MKDPKRKKSRFAFLRLDPKCESPFFHSTCINGFEPKYLLRSNCCQVPSMVSNLSQIKRLQWWRPSRRTSSHYYNFDEITKTYFSYDILNAIGISVPYDKTISTYDIIRAIGVSFPKCACMRSLQAVQKNIVCPFSSLGVDRVETNIYASIMTNSTTV
jgi:hypothetical protein